MDTGSVDDLQPRKLDWSHKIRTLESLPFGSFALHKMVAECQTHGMRKSTRILRKLSRIRKPAIKNEVRRVCEHIRGEFTARRLFLDSRMRCYAAGDAWGLNGRWMGRGDWVVRVQIIQTHMLSMMSELLRGEYKMVFDMWDRCGPLPPAPHICMHQLPGSPRGSTARQHTAGVDDGRHCTRGLRLESGDHTMSEATVRWRHGAVCDVS